MILAEVPENFGRLNTVTMLIDFAISPLMTNRIILLLASKIPSVGERLINTVELLDNT